MLLTLAGFWWIDLSGLSRVPVIHGRQTDYFNELAHGFRRGHLYLDHDVPPTLVHAVDPYDPAKRPDTVVLYDASYYRGHYYIYFGAAPVVTLLLPFALLTGSDLPLPYAIWFFCSVGYLALLALLLHLWRQYFPRAGPLTVWAGLIAVSGATLLGGLLRRPSIWEMAIASGFAFFSLALLCLIRALASLRPLRWAVAGGLALGLAAASRPNYALGAVLFILPLVWRRSGPAGGRSYGWREVWAAGIPCAAIGAILLAYNYGRFGHLLEFGIRYQLNSKVYPPGGNLGPAFFRFNALVYFLTPLRWVEHFPFLNGIAFPRTAAGYYGCEYCFGVLANLPFAWFGVAAVALGGWPAARGRGDSAPWRIFGLLGVAIFLNALPILFFIGSAIRYLADFAPYLMLMSALGLWLLEARLARPGARVALALAGCAAAGFSAFVAEMATVDLYDETPGVWPAAYRPMARVLNAPVIVYEHLRGRYFGPIAVTFSVPADAPARRETLMAAEGGGGPSRLWIDYGVNGAARLGLQASPESKPWSSPVLQLAPGSVHTVFWSEPGLYPRSQTEDFFSSLSRREYDRLRNWLYLSCDGAALCDRPQPAANDPPQTIAIGRDPAAAPAGYAPFSGRILSVARSPALAARAARSGFGGVRLRIQLERGMANRAFPLVATGHYAAGNFLIMKVGARGEVNFGYDHWGVPTLWSPEVALGFEREHVVEFWVPSALDRPSTQLVVKVDGRAAWRHEVRSFPNPGHEVYYGRNPIGGTTSEARLEPGDFESGTLPPPD